MTTVRGDLPATVLPAERWQPWPVNWSAVWVGALAALATALVFGLVGIALGAHQLGPAQRITDWGGVGLGVLAFSVFGAFLSFVVGGWIAGRIAGLHRSEPAMLHGAIVWLVTVPLLLALAAWGAGGYFGGWIGGLAGTPAWAVAPPATVDPNAAVVARNSALGAVTALLLGLVGSVIGGWMASGEPMTLTAYRTREERVERRVA
ncbi:MAG: hypothetical protein HY689_05540 [Chloroflexi bacterium]|nr:hypothetical protein [Chloroflexota bacterium]